MDETSEDQLNLEEPMSASERQPSSPASVSPLKQDVHMAGGYSIPHAYAKPENIDFAIGIAETYFSTEYWKSSISSESVHLKEEPKREKNENVCGMDSEILRNNITLLKEEEKAVTANLLPKKDQETGIKSPISVPSTVTSISFADMSSACGIHDLHSTPAAQDIDISNLINEVSLSNTSDMGSSVSALIEEVDASRDQSDLMVVSNPPGISKQTVNTKSVPPACVLPYNKNKMLDCESSCRTPIESAICSTADITMILNPEKTVFSLPPTSHHESRNDLACKYTRYALEDTYSLSSCIAPATVLKANPKRKGRTNWESLSDSNSGFSDNSDMEHTVLVPFTCTSSTGSSLVEVGGELQDLLITAYEYKREDMSQLASPLKLKHDQGTLYYNAVCEDLSNVNLHNTIRDEDIKFRSEKDQHVPYQESQSVDLLYNNYLQISGTQNEFLTFNMPKNPLSPNSPMAQKQPSPCKSKSLGDLTSEDISCNFESKYKYISRGFITSGMRDKMVASLKAKKPQSTDALTEQLRKLVSFDQEDGSQPFCPKQQQEDGPKILVRKLSSRSQSRVRNIASRAKERQEANKQKLSNNTAGVVLRNKPPATPRIINRHSTGSYIASYLDNFSPDDLEGRGVPEGACTSLRFGHRDQFYADDSLLETKSSEDDKPEIYFLLRL